MAARGVNPPSSRLPFSFFSQWRSPERIRGKEIRGKSIGRKREGGLGVKSGRSGGLYDERSPLLIDSCGLSPDCSERVGGAILAPRGGSTFGFPICLGQLQLALSLTFRTRVTGPVGPQKVVNV